MVSPNELPAKILVCITSEEPDMELQRGYRVLPDKLDARNGYVRVVDEEYLYQASHFVPVKFPDEAEQVFVKTS